MFDDSGEDDVPACLLNDRVQPVFRQIERNDSESWGLLTLKIGVRVEKKESTGLRVDIAER